MNEVVLHIMDIVYNSIRANASLVTINISFRKNILCVEIIDDGDGIDSVLLKDIKSPFKTSRTTRNVGLGISLFELSAKLANGKLDVTSQVNKFTKVYVEMDYSHIDCIEMGDLGETIYLLSIASNDCEIKFNYSKNGKEFTYDSKEVKDMVGSSIVSDYEVITWIKEYINENILKMEVSDEEFRRIEKN